MSVADKIERLTDARNAIRTALSGKGIGASMHGFEAFADDIDAIAIGVDIDGDDLGYGYALVGSATVGTAIVGDDGAIVGSAVVGVATL